jgi:protein-L-isoaspartate(D-aspartate) O-methyltransferase
MTEAETRQRFAQGLMRAAGVRDPRVAGAFAAVPRETFLPPPPWHIEGPGGGFTSSDPAALYGDVRVAIEPGRDLWQAEPQLWAFVIDRLAVPAGGRVLLVGAGSGYLAAILAELVGDKGAVTALEAVPALAGRARLALRPWTNVRVLAMDAGDLTRLPFDRILFTCGITGLPAAWPDQLQDGARLAAPFTGADDGGVLLLLERRPDGIRVTPLSGVRIQPALGGLRDGRQERVLDGVRLADKEALWQARSLRPQDATRPAERIYGFAGQVLSMRPLGQ